MHNFEQKCRYIDMVDPYDSARDHDMCHDLTIGAYPQDQDTSWLKNAGMWDCAMWQQVSVVVIWKSGAGSEAKNRIVTCVMIQWTTQSHILKMQTS